MHFTATSSTTGTNRHTFVGFRPANMKRGPFGIKLTNPSFDKMKECEARSTIEKGENSKPPRHGPKAPDEEVVVYSIMLESRINPSSHIIKKVLYRI